MNFLFSKILKKNIKKPMKLIERWQNDEVPFKILNDSEGIQKFNPYHDKLGRFASANGASSFAAQRWQMTNYDDKKRAFGTEKVDVKVRGHIDFENPEKTLQTLKQELNFDTKKAEAYYNSVSNFTTSDCKGIRAYQQGDKTAKDFSHDAEVIEDYINKAPQWNGGTLYRGISLKDGNAEDVFKAGAELDMQGTSSWSSDVGISEMFTKGQGTGTKVIFQCDKISKATSVKHISWNSYENEVLVSKDTKYVSKGVKKKGRYYYVYLEEVVNVGKTFGEIMKFNPYHDRLGRFATTGNAASFTYKPGASTAHSKAIEREKAQAGAEKGFKGTLYHGSPNTDIEEFDMSRAGQNTSSGEKLLFFTDSKQMADDFSYERLDGSSKYLQQRGKKGRVYEVDVEMKNPLDFRKLSDTDIDNILKLDGEGLLTKDIIQAYAKGNHQLLKAGLTLTADKLKELGYDGLIANTGKAGHNSLEYAVVDSKQATIKKALTFSAILKFNPYHDKLGRFASANGFATFSANPDTKAGKMAIERASQNHPLIGIATGTTQYPKKEPEKLSYEELIQQAKDLGIKGVRVGLRRETLEQKIRDAKEGKVTPSKKKTFSDYWKESKQREIDRFYGEGNTKKVSNKYFKFKHAIDDDNCIVVTNNIKTIKGNPVLVVGKNQAVYLKDWQFREVHNFSEGIEAYAVKLNRNFFKPYTFRFEFDEFDFGGKSYTFDDMLGTAKQQDTQDTKWADGHTKYSDGL